MFRVDNLSFFGQAFAEPIAHKLWSSTKFAQDHLYWTSAYSHCVGYHVDTDSTILQNNSFHSITAFLADSFGRTSWPGFNFKAFSASTELGSPAFYCGIWRCIFTVYNSHSVVYLLWRNILQCRKLYHCTITNSVKITHSVWPAIFNKLYIAKQTSRSHVIFREH